VFKEAAQLGVMQVHLSGGEPGARRDLVEIVASAREAGLYTNLITSGVGITTRALRDLWEAGLDHVQVSIQDSDATSSDHIAGYRGAFQRKIALATEVVRLGLPLTINAVVHRANIARIGEMVALAIALRAKRVELAHVQYYGWALKNRAALMPSREQVDRAVAQLDELRRRYKHQIVIDAVVPDYYARFPKPCIGLSGKKIDQGPRYCTWTMSIPVITINNSPARWLEVTRCSLVSIPCPRRSSTSGPASCVLWLYPRLHGHRRCRISRA
jgi:PqqA peptide cyclase